MYNLTPANLMKIFASTTQKTEHFPLSKKSSKSTKYVPSKVISKYGLASYLINIQNMSQLDLINHLDRFKFK